MIRQSLTGWAVIQMRSTIFYKLRTYRIFHSAAKSPPATNEKGQWMPYKIDLDMTYSKTISRFTLLRHKLTQPTVLNPSQIPPKAFSHEDFTHEDFTVRFRASCIDTAAELPEDVKDRMPTILCVHGSGGSHEDFVPLLNDLVEDHGFRAVCLNWPGFGKTAEITKARGKAVYSFSSEENVNFLLSFMSKIQLNRLDIIIGHDIGCVSAAYVSARLEVSPAFVVISPLITIPTKSILFAMLSVTISRLWTTWPSFRPMLGLLIKSTRLGQRFSGKNGIHRVNAALGIMGLDGQLVNQIVCELQLKKLPKLCVYGTEDTFTDQSIKNKTAAKFGFGQEQFDMYDDDNQIIQKGTVPEDHYSKGILFKGAGNAPHRSEAYITVIQKEILKMFELNQKTKS